MGSGSSACGRAAAGGVKAEVGSFGYEGSHTEAEAAPCGSGAHGCKEAKIVQLADQSVAEGANVATGEHTKEVKGQPLVVVYWNVAGIPFNKVDIFWEDLGDRGRWDVLILLEFSAARKPMALSGVRESGHLVNAQPYEHGRRAGALVFHNRLGVRAVTFCSHGRNCAADFSWGGWEIRVVGAHMDANNDREPYGASLNDFGVLARADAA